MPVLHPALSLSVLVLALGTAACGSSSAPATTSAGSTSPASPAGNASATSASPAAPSVSGPIAVESGDKTCTVARTELAPGTQTLAAKNTGGAVTEVYVYGPDNKVVGEVENIGPGTTRELVVKLGPGRYEIACKPGMTGDGIRTAVTVTGG